MTSRRNGIIKVMDASEVCDPGSRLQSMSSCMELALLRLQSIWIKKIILSGVLIPVAKSLLGIWYEAPADALYKLVVLFAYAVLTCGHLPLVMPIILLAMLSETLMAALSCQAKKAKRASRAELASSEVGIFGAPSLRMALALSTLIHLASASKDLVIFALFSAFLFCQLMKRTLTSTYANSASALLARVKTMMCGFSCR